MMTFSVSQDKFWTANTREWILLEQLRQQKITQKNAETYRKGIETSTAWFSLQFT